MGSQRIALTRRDPRRRGRRAVVAQKQQPPAIAMTVSGTSETCRGVVRGSACGGNPDIERTPRKDRV
jgi:hypothetical protein